MKSIRSIISGLRLPKISAVVEATLPETDITPILCYPSIATGINICVLLDLRR